MAICRDKGTAIICKKLIFNIINKKYILNAGRHVAPDPRSAHISAERTAYKLFAFSEPV